MEPALQTGYSAGRGGKISPRAAAKNAVSHLGRGRDGTVSRVWERGFGGLIAGPEAIGVDRRALVA